MRKIYLASAALAKKDFDGCETIRVAKKTKFDGVQLYLDPRYRNPEYLQKVINLLNQTDLSLAIHLPDTVEQEDIKATHGIVKVFPQAKVFIHYLPTTKPPKIRGTKVGWENSMIGPLGLDQKKHLRKVKAIVAKDKSFLAFDPGRFFYPSKVCSKQELISFTKQGIKKLDPKVDLLHVADKSCMRLRYKECKCTLGKGVMAPVLKDIKNFQGIIVIEHENLKLALESLQVLKETTTRHNYFIYPEYVDQVS